METFSPVWPRTRVGTVPLLVASASCLLREVIKVVAAAVWRNLRRSMLFRLTDGSRGCIFYDVRYSDRCPTQARFCLAWGEFVRGADCALQKQVKKCPTLRDFRRVGFLTVSFAYQFNFIANWNWRGS